MLEESWADVGVPRRILAILALTFGAAKAQRAPRHFLKPQRRECSSTTELPSAVDYTSLVLYSLRMDNCLSELRVATLGVQRVAPAMDFVDSVPHFALLLSSGKVHLLMALVVNDNH